MGAVVMVTRHLVSLVLAAVVGAATAATQSSLAPVPDSVPGDLRRELLSNRAKVEARIDHFNRRATDYNARCQGIPTTHPTAAACQRERAALEQEAPAIERDKSVFNASVASAAVVVTDPMVVDARVTVAGSELVAQVPQLQGSPGATAMAKGFQAVINHDWTLALAWWQTAQLRDPANPAIAAGVDMAQWMVDYYRKNGKTTTTSTLRSSRAVPSPTGWYLQRPYSTLQQLERDAVRLIEQAVGAAEEWRRRNPRRP